MRRFGELEAVVMDRLWARGRPTSVREVLEELQRERSIAYTTVMTVMDNLQKKGWLTRELNGRAYLYTPVASREAYSAELMRAALDESADPTATLVHFLGQMSAEEDEDVRAALQAALRARRRKPTR